MALYQSHIIKDVIKINLLRELKYVCMSFVLVIYPLFV